MTHLFKSLRGTTRIVLALVLTFYSFVSMADVVSTGWLNQPEHPPVKTRFVLTGQVDSSKKTVEGFLEVELTGDWKTYWRSPGEGGIAPSIDWKNSRNFTAEKWHWPFPQRFELLGIETVGYKGDIVFPMTLQVEDFSQPVVLDATLTLSTCTTVCVLTDYPIKLEFTPNQLTLSGKEVHLHAQAMSHVPQASPNIKTLAAVWEPSTKQIQLVAERATGWTNPEILVDGDSEKLLDYHFSKPEIQLDGQKLIATLTVDSWLGDPELDNEQLNMTIKDDNFLAEQKISVSSGVIVPRLSGEDSLASMFLIALLGGLILNVMPCVLPVLGMKLSGVISAQGLARKQIRWQFLASSAGIVTSFWLLALFLVLLKLSGGMVGWGIQFQSPWFIGVMVAITALFGANMLGLFEIRLSSNANTWMAAKGDSSYLGHFTQGMFATLLATPCSAPFLGTAVAFALGADSVTIFVIFTALALGMSMPWLLVAAMPSIASLLPKPGNWMNKVKWLFGGMMLLTSLWLLSLLANHLPVFWVVVIAASLFIWMLLRSQRVYGNKVMAVAGGSALLLTVGGLLLGSFTAQHWVTPLPQEPAWQPLSNEIITKSVEQGKTVFVNVTADWCVTCKANKIGVLLQNPVYDALNHQNVVPIEADWTHPEGKVTDFLQSHGRYGVPFNIVYGPNAPQGIPLPVILSEESVMDALSRAGG
ncbi:protein-disulfide reductase DsbD family protein [Vibrio sp. TRT 17S01]|uniref:protein-disulfide reductase DsbD family protein n=1 Tax=Vibrio sp. TRT 17S01 TaxID=3418505 RepID=UPI003CEF2DF2